MPELVIAMEPANVDKTMKKKGMMVPDITSPEMEEMRHYLVKMREFIDKMEEMMGGTEREDKIAKPDEKMDESKEEKDTEDESE